MPAKKTSTSTAAAENTAKTTATAKAPLRILVLQRGFIYIGRVIEETDALVVVEGARCIRRWGTPGKGLALLANAGPQPNTELDDQLAEPMRAHPLAIINQLGCVESAWEGKL